MKVHSPIGKRKSSLQVPPASRKELVTPLTAGIAAFVVAVGVFAIYIPALNFQFILDDHRFISDPRLQFPGHVWEYFTSYVWAQVQAGPVSFYRPLFVLWLRFNFILSEMSPWGWHLVSILKHLLVAGFLGLVVWRLLRDRVAALIAATLFALHPAHTESVAWVTVPDPLMSAALLGSLLLYLVYAERTSGSVTANNPARKSRKHVRNKAESSPAGWLLASAAAFLAALMIKETAIVWPVVVFALALFVPVNNTGGVKATKSEGPDLQVRIVSAFRETLPFLGAAVIYLVCRYFALGRHLSPATQHLALHTVLLSWPATLWFYLKVMVWPVRPRGFADPTLVGAFSLREVVLPALGVGCAVGILIWAGVWVWRRSRNDLPEREAIGVQRALLIGALILVIPILLALNLNALNPGDFLHGRYTYFPLTGVMILLATLWHVSNRGRIVLLAGAGALAVALGVLTVTQESAWKDDLTVFTVAHENAPHNGPVAQSLVRAHVQGALELDQEGRCDEAVPIFEQAIKEYPQDWFAWAGLGECRFKLNDLTGAEQSLRRATELSHEPRVKEQWQAIREKMGLPSVPLD